jgi:hypothetical protein
MFVSKPVATQPAKESRPFWQCNKPANANAKAPSGMSFYLLFIGLTYEAAKRICHPAFVKRNSETNE